MDRAEVNLPTEFHQMVDTAVLALAGLSDDQIVIQLEAIAANFENAIRGAAHRTLSAIEVRALRDHFLGCIGDRLRDCGDGKAGNA